jgi:hypothetical protein
MRHLKYQQAGKSVLKKTSTNFVISAHSPRHSSCGGGGGKGNFIETELFLAGLNFDLKGHYRLRVTCTVLTDEENKTQQF